MTLETGKNRTKNRRNEKARLQRRRRLIYTAIFTAIIIVGVLIFVVSRLSPKTVITTYQMSGGGVSTDAMDPSGEYVADFAGVINTQYCGGPTALLTRNGAEMAYVCEGQLLYTSKWHGVVTDVHNELGQGVMIVQWTEGHITPPTATPFVMPTKGAGTERESYMALGSTGSIPVTDPSGEFLGFLQSEGQVGHGCPLAAAVVMPDDTRFFCQGTTLNTLHWQGVVVLIEQSPTLPVNLVIDWEPRDPTAIPTLTLPPGSSA